MKKLSLILIGLFIIALAIVLFAKQTKANPSFFERFQTNSATTTVVYMQPGQATTTVTALNPQNTAFESALVNIQVTATSTGVTGQVLLNARVEGSMDNVDWYPIVLSPTTVATTTLLTSNPYNMYQLALSTTTVDINPGSGSTTRIHQTFAVPTYTKHLRVEFMTPAGGGKYGLWAEIVTKRQSN